MVKNSYRILTFCADTAGLKRLSNLFEQEGHIVASALTVRELLSLLEDDSFDAVIISDRNNNGIVPGLLPEIRSICREAHLLAIKSEASRKDILDSLNSGCSYFIDRKCDEIPEITARVIDRGRALPATDSQQPQFRPDPSLSRRETEILYEMLCGKTNREIGEALGIQEKTVKNHLWKIYRKYGIDNRTELFGMLISDSPYFRSVRDYRGEKLLPEHGQLR
jgi:DNA-binding NarL/FixJ family response regulator